MWIGEEKYQKLFPKILIEQEKNKIQVEKDTEFRQDNKKWSDMLSKLQDQIKPCNLQ